MSEVGRVGHKRTDLTPRHNEMQLKNVLKTIRKRMKCIAASFMA